MSEQPILVTGATGKSGRRVVSRLRDKGLPVRAAARGGEYFFDWNDADSWDGALEGVHALYLMPLDGMRLVQPFVERAARHGVRRIVLASGRSVDVPGYVKDTAMMTRFLDGEAAVRESGLEWTISRPGWFSQNFSEGFFAADVRSGELRLPGGDGAVTYIDVDDIADVVVAALTEDGHSGEIYDLSGDEALTLHEVAATISEHAGREVRYVPITVERYVEELLARGWPADFADVIEPLREGRDEHVSDGVGRALGRKPRTFAEFAATTAAQGGWD
ncbi:NAD(P)H-binding protein [Saccharothrix violaceirubra]|uniref:Uncharacterized protein YbjT (DUF2867 family) n=1 Tax=Saccharothrix violaceirubra TaxID=413306 RepID=A0A7W7T3G6_9PSEU|nr:NAD(P)H-binding protein [Saccharothrix violaceirubra]MBB4965902.1 uncharacterized protein YbjT (DUF2867 family) [Saccharothrix violaceirubra]